MRKSTVRGLSFAVGFSASTMAFASLQAAERTIVGAWTTSVTLLNCQSGEPVGVPPFPGLATFNDGGTMSEYGISPGLTPALRSPGHGIWQREHGWRDYSFKFTFYRYNASGAFIAGFSARSIVSLNVCAVTGWFERGEKRKPLRIVNV